MVGYRYGHREIDLKCVTAMVNDPMILKMQRKEPELPVFKRFDEVSDLVYRSRFIIVILFSLILLLSGCSKNPAANALTMNLYQQFFEIGRAHV